MKSKYGKVLRVVILKKTSNLKKICIVFQLLLLIWFFLDMTGAYIGDTCLATQAYQEDGIFFLIYFVTVILFIAKTKIGKWLVVIWTSLWFLVQFLSHEWYTIFDRGIIGTAEGKIAYFSEAMKWLVIEGKYIPDVYHTVLHMLILLVIISTLIFIIKSRRRK